MGGADFIVDGPVGLQASGALVEFFPVQETDAVDDQMAMQVVGVDVVATSTSGLGNSRWASSKAMAWASWGVRSSRLCKGLDEVVVLPPVVFGKPFFGELHLGEDRLGSAVPAGHQPAVSPTASFSWLI